MAQSRCRKMSQNVAEQMETFLDKLVRVWDDIGIPEEQQSMRQNVVVLHINNLLKEMITEEENLLKRLKENIDKYSSKLMKLCQEMILPDFEVPDCVSVVTLEKDLRIRYEILSKDKNDRLSKLKQLINKDKELSARMNVLPLDIRPNAVPTLSQLDLLEASVYERQQEMDQRLEVFNETKTKIVRLLEDLIKGPETAFERAVACEPVELFVLSTENMASLKHFLFSLEQHQRANMEIIATLQTHLNLLVAELGVTGNKMNSAIERHSGCSSKVICTLQEEVNQLEHLKEQRAKDVVKEAQRKLHDLWERCFYSREQREPYQHLCQCDYKVVSLPLIKQEIEKVQAYYDSHKEVLDKVYLHQHIFKDFFETERKATHPDRLYTGSSNFLMEEKARSKLIKEIAESEQDALSAVEDWEKRTGCLFLIDGSRYKDRVKSQWQEYKAEIAAQQICQLKARVARAEAQTSAKKSATPVKRQLACITPNKVATKLLKFETEGPRSAPQSYALSYSPHHQKADSRGVRSVVPCGLGVVTGAKVPGQVPFGSVSTNKRINHGSIFSPIQQPPSSMKAKRRRQLFSPLGIKSHNEGENLVPKDKPAPQSVKCSESSENVAPVKFSSTTVVSGIEPLPNSQNMGGCQLTPVEPSYQEFTKGLSESGKTNLCSSILSSDKDVKLL